MVTERDVRLAGGRILHVHDTGPDSGDVTVLWHHGSPQTGAPLDPVLAAAAARGLRLVGYGRPSYGGSTPNPGRDVASAGADVAALVDALEVDRFATMGASGGGPHALAVAAALPDRVTGVVTLAGLTPYSVLFDWYDGMVAPEALRSAAAGREARLRFADTEEFDERSFGAADYAALAGDWASLGADAGRAGAAGPDGLVDDDVAFAAPWGFELEQVAAPVLLVHGDLDRVVPPSHSARLLDLLPSAQLWRRPRDGHVSVLAAVPVALDWLIDVAR